MSPDREYFAEGEYVPGSKPKPYYYGTDQLGTVRRAFESTTTAPAYDYDPYGEALQTAAPVTDFTYAGLFYNADSGLDLATRRVYDPAAGRWLSRDALGEASDPVANLYRYVNDNPISLTDRSGLYPIFPRSLLSPPNPNSGNGATCPSPTQQPPQVIPVAGPPDVLHGTSPSPPDPSQQNPNAGSCGGVNCVKLGLAFELGALQATITPGVDRLLLYPGGQYLYLGAVFGLGGVFAYEYYAVAAGTLQQ